MDKGNKKIIVLLILGLILHQYQVDSQIIDLLSFTWDSLEKINTIHDVDAKLNTPSTTELLEKSEEIAKSLDKWGTNLDKKIDESVEMLLQRLPLGSEITNDIQFLNSYIVRIDELFTDFKYYLRSPGEFSDDALKDLLKSFTSRDGDDVQGTISQLHGLIVPQQLAKLKKSLFLLLAQQTQISGIQICDTGSSPQQRLIELFKVAMESEKRAFAMSAFGFRMRGIQKNVTVTSDIKRLQMKVEKRANQYSEILRQTMAFAEGRFRRCDPVQHERGVTFYEFEKFLQAYIIQESVLYSDWECGMTCGGHSEPVEEFFLGCEGIGCENGPNACAGRLIECRSNYHRATVCELQPPNSRRYEWFKDGEGNLMGDNSILCRGNIKTGNIHMIYGIPCDVCRCTCVEDTPRSKTSNHFISLREQITNIKDNMVVTGLRFETKDQITHLRVMQGKIGPNSEVFRNSSVWLEEEDIEFDWKESREIFSDYGRHEYVFYIRLSFLNFERLIVDKDIAVLTWDKRRLHLDTLKLEPSYVVTGVRFRRIEELESSPIQLEVHATRFDKQTGQLDLESSKWVTPDDMQYAQLKDAKRAAYPTQDMNDPSKSTKTEFDTEPYTYMDLYHTSYELDAAQTTIPFLDAQPLISDPPVPLVSIGLYHKREPGYGGFLSFIVEGLDQSPYV